MKMAIAVETAKHPEKRMEYKVWYLELNATGDVVGIGVKSRKELVNDLFTHYRKYGKSNWRAFLKNSDESSPIEIYDFISQNMHENTHFGNLPRLGEFQETVDRLQMQMEFRSIA